MGGTTKKRSSSTKPGAKAAPVELQWPKRLGQFVGITVVLGLIALMLFNSDPISGVPDGTETLPVTSAEHISGNIYAADDVPAGGAMDSAWANCGFYDTPMRAENVMHSLEHGAVWITYSSDLGSEEVDGLRRFTGGVEKILVSPVPNQGSLIIASAWGNQLEISDADDQRLEQFVNEFEGSGSAPERGGRCSGGVGNPVG